MNAISSPSVHPNAAQPDAFAMAPASVRCLRVLGNGRAAQARLVEATLPDGNTITCVEKIFAPGLLTRVLYRLSFQSPFSYQSNRDAIAACFYRRRVAAAMIAASDIAADVARPIYVRFDESTKAWVLAAEWIRGRGIRPAPVDSKRIGRWLSRKTGWLPKLNTTLAASSPSEIEQLVSKMSQLENLFCESGLIGSGWQVAPRAMVSTANLLRVDDGHTIVDLESGIPAVLVPKYLAHAIRRGQAPPFDDLHAETIRTWYGNAKALLPFRIGPDQTALLCDDIERLIHHDQRWKASEIALFRRPWRLFRYGAMTSYQVECLRRWKQEGLVDPATFDDLCKKAASVSPRRLLIWWSGTLLPGPIGKQLGRIIGNRNSRRKAIVFLIDSRMRQRIWNRHIRRRESTWIDDGRMVVGTHLNGTTHLFHAALALATSPPVHRIVTDRRHRQNMATTAILLLISSRYQAWFGIQKVTASIDAWHRSERISESEAETFKRELSGNEMSAYVRGFGIHLSLKALAPIVVPAKVGGVASFFATGNPWFLSPLFLMPLVRVSVAIASWLRNRADQVPHAEAVVASLIPTIGTLAFPLQMFATRPLLSTFLIRDAAAKTGRRIPIYGGPESRTEIAMIRLADFLIEAMGYMSAIMRRLTRGVVRRRPDVDRVDRIPIQIISRTRLGRWAERQALARINQTQPGSNDAVKRSLRDAV